MIVVLRRTAVHCGVATALVIAAMVVWPVSSAPASALPREPHGSVATIPIDLRAGDGGCSSPLGGTRWGFAAACELHDHRYDLLRRAAAQGTPLPPSARRAADAAFGTQVNARCEGRAGVDAVGCRITARLYAGAVAANSWRQRYGPPLHEPALPWLAGTGVAVVVLASVGMGLVGAGVGETQPPPMRRPSIGEAT